MGLRHASAGIRARHGPVALPGFWAKSLPLPAALYGLKSVPHVQ